MHNPINQENLNKALTLLAGRLDLAHSEAVRLVVCGGSALIAMGLRKRTTRDMDVVALLNVKPALTAARWAMTHDVSEGFKMVLKELLTQLGHESIAKNI